MRAASAVRAKYVAPPQYATEPLTAVGAARLTQLAEENQQLRALLSLQSATPLHSIPAEVIGRNNLPWEGNLLIGKGTAEGVTPHMVALVPDGVLGQVIAVSAHTAEILPLTDPAGGIPAMIARTKAPGVLKGDGEGRCQLLYLTGDADVAAGDAVITSGLGLIFPRGFPLGRITTVTSNATLSSRIATVQPAVNPATVMFVLLVK